MGDPKFSTRKFETPSHPWKAERIAKENELIVKYGLKNKKELWRAEFLLSNIRTQGRNLLARTRIGDQQALKEEKQLLDKLYRMGLVGENSKITDVLGIDIESILSRRFQSIVYMKGLANTQKQSRQFITHGHVSIGDRRVTIPGYLVRKVEEATIDYNQYSPISNELHPMRPRDEPDFASQPAAAPAAEKKEGPAEPEKADGSKEGEPVSSEKKDEPASGEPKGEEGKEGGDEA